MGKSEILMLLAGVILSIALALVAIPMFSSGQEMADRTKIQKELISLKEAMPLVRALEGGLNLTGEKLDVTTIVKHIDNMKFNGNVSFLSQVPDVIFTIEDKGHVGIAIATRLPEVIITITTTDAQVDLSKITRLKDICDGVTKASNKVLKSSIVCTVKR